MALKRIISLCYENIKDKFFEHPENVKNLIEKYFTDIKIDCTEDKELNDLILALIFETVDLKKVIVNHCVKATLESDKVKQLIKIHTLIEEVKAEDKHPKKRKVDTLEEGEIDNRDEAIKLIHDVEASISKPDIKPPRCLDLVSHGPKPLTPEEIDIDRYLRRKYPNLLRRTSRRHMFNYATCDQLCDMFTWQTTTDKQYNRQLPIGWDLVIDDKFLKDGELMYMSNYINQPNLVHIVDKYGDWRHYIRERKSDDYYYKQIHVGEISKV